jgi:hypothetical protein
MTESEWLECDDLESMLIHLRERVSDRKLLFAVACCRRISHLFGHSRSADALDAAEQFADGQIPASELRVRCVRRPHRSLIPNTTLAVVAASCESRLDPAAVASHAAISAGGNILDGLGEWLSARAAERAAQTGLLHCIIGNPFRPVTLDSTWLTSDVTALARQMYESRDFSAMPILADALQDAECESADILNHCRGPGTHVRGCWVVDLVLGRE